MSCSLTIHRWFVVFFLALAALFVSADQTASADAPATTKSTFDNLKTLAWSAVTGTLPPVDIEARHKADVEAGAIRITDANFTDLIEGSEPDAVWIIFIHEDRSSVLNQGMAWGHANATRMYNEAVASSDKDVADSVPRNVRWAKLDFMTEWRTCARLIFFRPPSFLVVSDQGKELRFVSTSMIVPEARNVFGLMRDEAWKGLKPWTSRYGPNGNRSWVVEKYIAWYDFSGQYTNKVPSVVWLLATGAFAKWLLGIMHSPKSTTPARPTTGASVRGRPVTAAKKSQ